MDNLKTFCILPFTHLATYPQGEVIVCCESKIKLKHKGEVVKLGSMSIEDIRNSDTLSEIRSDMLNGKQHSACEFCYSREKAGLVSKRIRENTRYKFEESKIETYKELPLYSIELRLGNVCNAKCIICNPYSSSKWNEDTDEFIKTNFEGGYEKTVSQNKWYKEDRFYEDVLKNITNVQHLWFNGGEPLLIKEHITFLNKVVEQNHSANVELEYHTNGTMITQKLIKLWSNFKFVKISLSIDDIEERFEYSRYPLKFDTVKKGIELLKQNNIHYDIIPTISLLNIFNIEKIYSYYKEYYGKTVIFNYLRFPKFQSIVNLPETFKINILNQVQLPEPLLKELKFELYSDEHKGIQKAISFYKHLDSKRNLDINKALPEFKNLTNKI